MLLYLFVKPISYLIFIKTWRAYCGIYLKLQIGGGHYQKNTFF